MTRISWYKMRWQLRWLLTVLLTANCLLASFLPVHAQDGGRVVLLQLAIEQFPTIDFYIEAYNAQNQLLLDLQPNQIKVLEDGKERPLTRFERVEPGLQLFVAFNAAPIMAARQSGVSAFEDIQKALVVWAQSQPASDLNEFSLATNSGLQIARSTRPEDWVKAIQAYTPDLMASQPGLASLTQALNLAVAPNPRPASKRAILYVTSLPESTSLEALPGIASQAASLGVSIFVWLVAPAGQVPPAAEALNQLASSTGGELFTYVPGALLDLEAFLRPLRYRYHGQYSSAVKQSGEHRVQIRIEQEDLQASSSEQTFAVQVSPPNPIFLSPPVQITRTWLEAGGSDSGLVLSPGSVPVQILIEFPDQHTRPLVRSCLYVDGVLVDENTQAPFDQFDWDLQALTESGRHMLKVELEDSLGLTGTTIETMVEVKVRPKPLLGLGELVSQEDLAVYGALLVAAVALTFVLVRAGQRSRRAREQRVPRKDLLDPVSQPVRIQQEQPARSRASIEMPTLPRYTASAPALEDSQTAIPARLLRLSESGHPILSGAIPLNRSEITFGSDPQQAVCVLDSTSVSPLHARLIQTAKAKFVLADAGSIAGTWVNYAPVSSQGVELEHGDLIHIGRIAFRFEYTVPTQVRRVTVSSHQEDIL